MGGRSTLGCVQGMALVRRDDGDREDVRRIGLPTGFHTAAATVFEEPDNLV